MIHLDRLYFLSGLVSMMRGLNYYLPVTFEIQVCHLVVKKVTLIQICFTTHSELLLKFCFMN